MWFFSDVSEPYILAHSACGHFYIMNELHWSYGPVHWICVVSSSFSLLPLLSCSSLYCFAVREKILFFQVLKLSFSNFGWWYLPHWVRKYQDGVKVDRLRFLRFLRDLHLNAELRKSMCLTLWKVYLSFRLSTRRMTSLCLLDLNCD